MELPMYPEDKPLPSCALCISVSIMRNDKSWTAQIVIDSEEISGKTLAEIGAGLQRSVYSAAHAAVSCAHQDTEGWQDVSQAN